MVLVLERCEILPLFFGKIGEVYYLFKKIRIDSELKIKLRVKQLIIKSGLIFYLFVNVNWICFLYKRLLAICRLSSLITLNCTIIQTVYNMQYLILITLCLIKMGLLLCVDTIYKHYDTIQYIMKYRLIDFHI